MPASPKRPSVARVRALLRYYPKSGKLRWREDRGGKVKAGSCAGTIVSDGHRQVWLNYQRFQATHLIWVLMTGAWPPPDKMIDHKDGDPSNDRWSNLRLATRAQNQQNRARWKNKLCGLPKGVHRNGNGFSAGIVANGQGHYLGTFRTAFAAALQYRDAAKRLHGEFART